MRNLSLKIKTRLLYVLPVYLLLFVAANLFYVYDVIEERDRRVDWFNDSIQLATQLYIVGYDMVLYPSEQRPKAQWNILSKRFSEQLQRLKISSVVDQSLNDRLLFRYQRLEKLFQRITRADEGRLAAERKEYITRQLLVHAESVVFDILEAQSYSERSYSDKRNRILAVTFIGVLLFLLLNSILVRLISTTVLDPLTRLKSWAKAFSHGHLDKDIKLEQEEFAEIVEQFREISWQLKNNYHETEQLRKENSELKSRLEAADLEKE